MSSSVLVDPPAPLGGYSVVSGTSAGVVREAVNSFTSDEHELVPAADELKAVVNGVRVGSFGLLYVRYGAKVQVVAPPTGKRVVVAVPTGPMHVRGPSGRMCTTTAPFVLSMEGPTTMVPDAEAGCLVGAVDAADLEDTLFATTGISRPLRFLEPGELQDIQEGPDVVSSTWTSVCRHLDTLGRDRLGNPAQRLMAQMLMSSVLVGMPHSARSSLETTPADVGPAYVAQATEYMEAHLAEPLSMVEVAQAVNVSVRQLNAAFRMHRGTTPTNQLRDLRLARAHQLLADANPDETVSNIAFACGFLHLGRFSNYYAQRYGCLPSDTQRGRRHAG
ncbi:hypothetical protein GCM10023081_46270 [Arthrobacter ginkgonis]|uniref:HTH araC/xylS-type domain-containing protein n=1 Tax=Arthrobacter ginkgonis TaxID=1630594 RepID=A0ABP7DFI3_9MICC